jgi:hypothetical protein
VSARPRRRCGWCAVGGSVATTPLVMWLLLKQDVNDKGACVLVRRGGARWTSSASALTTIGQAIEYVSNGDVSKGAEADGADELLQVLPRASHGHQVLLSGVAVAGGVSKTKSSSASTTRLCNWPVAIV